MHGNVPAFDVCDRHYDIIKSELILGISVRILLVFSNKLFFLNSARRQIPLFANKKDLGRIEQTFFTGSFNYFQSEYEAAWVFFFPFCSSPFLSSRSNTCLSFFQ